MKDPKEIPINNWGKKNAIMPFTIAKITIMMKKVEQEKESKLKFSPE